MSARVILIDDDPAVSSSLRRALALEGYDVVVADDGEAALTMAERETPDLVVLDVMLPGIDGLTVCQHLRAVSSTPILMLTARDTVPDRVAGLDCRADDFLVKPFALDELLARVRALLRRVQPRAEGTLRYADVTLDLQTREAFRADQGLQLTPREYELLAVFLRHPRQALSREQLCQHVWGYAFEGESNFVDVAIKELRKKLEVGDRSRLIQTVRGYGYALREDTRHKHREFVTDTSQELRNSLLAIRTNLELLDRVTDTAARTECLLEARQQVERMGRLVADLLLLAQVEAGQILERPAG